MKKIISAALLSFIFTQCGTQKLNSFSEVREEKDFSKSEFGGKDFGIATYISSLGAGTASYGIFKMANPLRYDRYEALYAIVGGGLMAVEMGHLTFQGFQKRGGKKFSDMDFNQTANVLLYTGSGTAAFAVSGYTLSKLEDMAPKSIALAAITTMSLTHEALGNYSASEENKPAGIRTLQLLSYLNQTVPASAALLGASKEMLKGTFKIAEIKKETRALERKFAKASMFVGQDGKVLDSELFAMGIASEILQKKSVDTQEFARQIQFAFTLPYEAPVSILQQNKVTDPIALNIFKNRKTLRTVGLM